jgi:hypothetical protein
MGSRCGLAEQIGFRALILELNAPVNLVFIHHFYRRVFFAFLGRSSFRTITLEK